MQKEIIGEDKVNDFNADELSRGQVVVGLNPTTLLDQMELQLEDLEASAAEDEQAAEQASQSSLVKPHQRKRPTRKPLPDHLPRERVVVPAPENCPCCGSHKLSKLGEDITETLEVIPRQWKVVQTVREKFSCRECEKITQPPAPFHTTPRGFAGPNLLAMILFEKFGQHQPLNRQSERYRREGTRRLATYCYAS